MLYKLRKLQTKILLLINYRIFVWNYRNSYNKNDRNFDCKYFFSLINVNLRLKLDWTESGKPSQMSKIFVDGGSTQRSKFDSFQSKYRRHHSKITGRV